MPDDRQRFLDHLAAHPRDFVARKVFADWLDEFGTDADAEFAVVQRAWTLEKCDAVDWLTEYAARLSNGDFDGDKQFVITYDELLAAARNHLATGDDYCLPFDTPGMVWDDNVAFWRNYELATDSVVDEEIKTTFFRCAC